MQQFLSVIKTDMQLKQMIDQKQLKQQFDEKVRNRQNGLQLIPIDNRRISNRHMANMLQLENDEISMQIQNNRIMARTGQNNLYYTSSNNALNRFQNIVNEINLSTQLRETKQQQLENQESIMQL